MISDIRSVADLVVNKLPSAANSEYMNISRADLCNMPSLLEAVIIARVSGIFDKDNSLRISLMDLTVC